MITSYRELLFKSCSLSTMIMTPVRCLAAMATNGGQRWKTQTAAAVYAGFVLWCLFAIPLPGADDDVIRTQSVILSMQQPADWSIEKGNRLDGECPP